MLFNIGYYNLSNLKSYYLYVPYRRKVQHFYLLTFSAHVLAGNQLNQLETIRFRMDQESIRNL